jgi:hypothetical protein
MITGLMILCSSRTARNTNILDKVLNMFGRCRCNAGNDKSYQKVNSGTDRTEGLG